MNKTIAEERHVKKKPTKGRSAPAKDVDQYLKNAPKEARAMLEQLREIIKTTAPNADEVISYQMPAYKYHGPLVYFAAYKNHVGFYPASGSLIDAYKDELKNYETSKGTIRFPIGKPLPVALITKIVKARLEENEARPSKAYS